MSHGMRYPPNNSLTKDIIIN